ncbi:Cannabinoid receptor 2 [Trichoplax sp. H2]|nr:Cannabinoid receptor 2 [Trichoplax sp. H2]|eukprot:RDD42188.1 Cannabinoid receptor 2 [Trichoplax sp. H2]
MLEDMQGIPLNMSYYHKSTTVYVFHYIYGIIAGLSIVVNLTILLLIVCNKHLLRRPTNLILCSLALADLFTSIGLFLTPNAVIPWHYYHLFITILGIDMFCLVLASYYLFFTFGSISIVTITIIAYERWIAINKARHYRKIFTVKRAIIILTAVWLFIPGLNIDRLMMMRANQNWTLNAFPCRLIQLSSHTFSKACYYLALESLRIFIPILLMIQKYCSISRHFYHRQSAVKSYIIRGLKRNRIRRLTVIASTATAILLICWLPHELYYSLYLFQAVPHNEALNRTFKAMIVLNTVLNPIMYTAMNTFCKRKLLAILGRINICNLFTVKETRTFLSIQDYHSCGLPASKIYY